ncbi:MAG TPA: glycosyltransferase [Steroidobacteraceae bacterium]|nr:glycosyltransferase [Steroidobacteraceae bacterium]
MAVKEGDWSGRWLHANVRRGDVISVHWPSFLYYVPESRPRTYWNLLRFCVFMLALRARGARIVWTAHNLYPHDGGKAVLAHRIARQVVARLASLVAVHGSSSATRVGREFAVSSSRLLLIEHGNWLGFYANTLTRDAARRRLDIPAAAFVFLFIGLCKPYKNLEQLLRGHAALSDDSLLWIVGRFQSPAYRAAVRHAASLAAPGRTTIRDEFVKSDDLQLYLNACDAVVLPYREILTSGAAMLALSFGRPVVAPRMGTLEELVTEDCGVLYDPGRDGALTAALRKARTRRFGSDRIFARAGQFSWDRSAGAFVDRGLATRTTRAATGE